MKIIPQSCPGRFLASTWLALCIGFLVFAFMLRDKPDMPIAFSCGLIALTFPLGLPAGAAVGLSMSWLYANKGLPYDPFGDLMPSWLVMVLAGYFQWFMLAPAASRGVLKAWRRSRTL